MRTTDICAGYITDHGRTGPGRCGAGVPRPRGLSRASADAMDASPEPRCGSTRRRREIAAAMIAECQG